MALVLTTLRTFDDDTLAMDKAWLAMNDMEDHIFKLSNELFNLPQPMATWLEDHFTTRGKMMTMDALNSVVRKLCGPLEVTFNDIMNELIQYKEVHGPYSPK